MIAQCFKAVADGSGGDMNTCLRMESERVHEWIMRQAVKRAVAHAHDGTADIYEVISSVC